jgi:hypothetical protein
MPTTVIKIIIKTLLEDCLLVVERGYARPMTL